MYTFVLDKRALVLLIADVLVVAVLLVGGGFLLGMRWDSPTAAAQSATLAAPECPPTTARQAAVLADQPDAPPPDLEGTEPADPAAEPTIEEDGGAGDPDAAEEDPGDAGTEEPTTVAPAPPAIDTAPAAAAPLPRRPRPIAPMGPVEPVAPAPAPVPAPQRASLRTAPGPSDDGFALQVGAFRRKANCEAVVSDLESRGYQPYVVELTTARRNVLHAVRIGRYTDPREASRAAVDFARREQMDAIVQPAS